MKKGRILYGILLVAAILLLSVVFLGKRIDVYASDDADSMAWEVLDILNLRRAENGAGRLTMDANLVATAKLRAKEIVSQFSHTRPDGTDCFTAFPENQGCAGENIAAGQQSADEVMVDWMNSQGHRRNILDTDYTAIGIACIYVPGSKYGWHWVQCFGDNADTPASRGGASNWSLVTAEGFTFTGDISGEIRCKDQYGNPVINEFKSDGEYTYFFQADGTAMRNRLTYHPDGVHIIYFNEKGHEEFSDFAHVRRSISGYPVNDFCFFDVRGYMYVDVLTYNKEGTKIYYANPYGVMEVGKWFQISKTAKWADGNAASDAVGRYSYAREDGSLMTNQYTYDWLNRLCYMQGNGTAKYF